jgi:hypothetical protein
MPMITTEKKRKRGGVHGEVEEATDKRQQQQR